MMVFLVETDTKDTQKHARFEVYKKRVDDLKTKMDNTHELVSDLLNEIIAEKGIDELLTPERIARMSPII